MSAHTAFTVGGLCAVGGVMGYVKGRSIPSLVAGLGFGSLMVGAGYLIKENKEYGVELAATTSAALSLAMIPRALKGKPAPIAVGILGLGSAAYYASKWNQQRNGV
ncbi:hypothetical protein BASA50_000672 [Batrachochytrium salamandrivorans]|uniref:Uncharacterized protein n=1 Tax=Batrachochytrium salamandrivorans TaxID=1357716 RepID=A0ABQ8ETA0_9FUNG|nr:hypothetical protein BASA62_004907 [Batrachochytrium salamandrivorans]KAH6573158.1 hypothetical protein BASA60_006172 [Batrachochytrium salamandrivorans]KAH6579620.1 hypothetical protein BASA61_010136 [Batrachochytrium salamandrivorans]KAH6586207.1 hypothetical protein BASA50_000672 [Batrachochytrium salamandrivorans]KAH9245896.1 hypothetical protein BASA81_016598 [Batrachochytrium salamandrivorans]